MKINQVEELVGITKRNIRFYEKEGLLAPARNKDNGYREYSQADVDTLNRIKLLRKLDLPLEEIRKMQGGMLTLEDGLRRHIIQIARQRENLNTMEQLCQTLLTDGAQLSSLDAGRYLADMDRMEQEGTRFVNIKKHDTLTRYAGPIFGAVSFTALMVGVLALIIWAAATDPENAPPLGLLIFLGTLPVIAIGGVLLALWQRIKQIRGGEEDAAAQY